MKTVFKLFACMLFASTAISLQAFRVMNKSPYEIHVYPFETRECANSSNQNYLTYHHKIAPDKVIVTWIDEHHRDETFPVNDPCYIALQPGQMAEITMSEDIKKFSVAAS